MKRFDMGRLLDYTDKVTETRGKQTGYKDWTCLLEIDLTDPTAPRVTGGSCKYVWTLKSDGVTASYSGFVMDDDSYIQIYLAY